VFDALTGSAVILPDFIREYDDALTVAQRYDEGLDDFGPQKPAMKVFSEQESLAEIRGTLMLCEVDTIYSIEGNTVFIHPDAPEVIGGRAAVWLIMSYYATQPPLTLAEPENAWSTYAPELLIAGAGRQVARYIHDAALSQLFEADYQLEYQKVIAATTSRANSNLEMVIR